MSKRVYVRPIFPYESEQFLHWAFENTKGNFDPETPAFPSSRTWCAYDEDGPLVYQTVQQPLMLESLASRPGAKKEQIALAMKELTQNCLTQAHIGGVGEVYYLGSDADTDEFATNHIFEKLPYKVFRVKLADLLKKET